MKEKRSAVKRWLAFGPMILPDGRKARYAAALKNRANRAKWGAAVSKAGGPKLKGLFKNKTWTTQGNLIVRRGRRQLSLSRSASVRKAWVTRKAKHGKSGRKGGRSRVGRR